MEILFGIISLVLCVGSQSRKNKPNQTTQTIIQTVVALVLAALGEFSQKLLWQSLVTHTPLVNTATTTRKAEHSQFQLFWQALDLEEQKGMSHNCYVWNIYRVYAEGLPGTRYKPSKTCKCITAWKMLYAHSCYLQYIFIVCISSYCACYLWVTHSLWTALWCGDQPAESVAQSPSVFFCQAPSEDRKAEIGLPRWETHQEGARI